MSDSFDRVIHTERVLEEVRAERTRVVHDLGYTVEHDDQHPPEVFMSLASDHILDAAKAFAHDASYTARENLIEACQLLVAGVERMDRMKENT
jgi:hypothetical protein